ncbi:hypothetical protein IK110_01710 [Candidatus Saccharibacteria bacterium]|nr:hypothetical protein [Candidatus Saccharibacteria bacterium]
MNKDVIYIEPEQDITDIIANIKAAKCKIVALVPPKKAGVLRSAVNFKLIAKAARQSEKTVVLITNDEALRRLASTVSMPIAKSLSSKPQLPKMDDAEEFGDDEAESDTIESEEAPADELAEVGPEEEKTEEKKDAPVAVPVAVKPTAKKAATPKEEVIEGAPEPEEKEPKTKAEAKTAKNVDKMKKAKIPNFAKYRKFIILGAVVLILLIGFTVWATAIAPAAKITVTVRAAAANFTEKVTFVDNEDKSDPKKGILYLEQKSITKKAEAEFEVKTEVDKGEKARGTITIIRPKDDPVNDKNDLSFSIPANTVVTIAGKTFVVSEGGSANAQEGDIYRCGGSIFDPKFCLNKDINSGAIKVVAKEAGEAYNIPAESSDIALTISTSKKYSISSSAMTGGTSKKVKVVGKEDVEAATSELSESGEEEAREELTSQFSSEYILLGSMTASDPKITTSPELNQEVGDNVTPKIVREVKYTVFAVNRESVNAFIKAKLEESLKNDQTQQIYDTGIDVAFFESFQNAKDDRSAKLKTTTKTGPRVTDEIVAEMALGRKVGEVQSRLRSTKGVSEVKIDTSYFWVTSIPDDINKVQIEIKSE